MAHRNAPQPIEDRPTRRFDLRAPEVRRMFDEAAIAEAVREVDPAASPIAELRAWAAGLAASW